MHHRDRRECGAGAYCTSEVTGDKPQEGASVACGQKRRLVSTYVLVARRVPLVGAGKVDPELNPMEKAPTHDELLRRSFDVQDARSGGHPLRVAVGDPASAAVRVLMLESAVNDVRNCLETAVRVPRRPFGFSGGIVDLPHLVHVNERVDLAHGDASEGSSDGEALALEP